jgi:hypothetical protein
MASFRGVAGGGRKASALAAEIPRFRKAVYIIADLQRGGDA